MASHTPRSGLFSSRSFVYKMADLLIKHTTTRQMGAFYSYNNNALVRRILMETGLFQ